MLGQTRAAGEPGLDLEASLGGARPSLNQGFPRGFLPENVRSQGYLGLNFAFDPDLWGRQRSALAAATTAAQAAQVDVAQARLLLASSVVRTYADLMGAFARRDRAMATIANAEADLAVARQRTERGLDNAMPLRSAEEALDRAQGSLALANEDIAVARNMLAALVGEGPDRGLAIARPQMADPVALALPHNLPADLVGRRPDLVAARLRAEAAAARIGVARADFYPSVNLAAVIGLQAVPLDLLFRHSSITSQFGPALRLPIFDGGAIAARYEGARGAYDEAVAAYNAALLTAVRQVAEAAASKRAIAIQLAEAREAEAAARAQLALAQQRADAGLADNRAVLTEQRDVISAERSVAALIARDRQADVALAVALGGGFDETGKRDDETGDEGSQ
jgi:NodT family efflux transporter outer membrane factor (OMF) lipoprotein